MVLTLKQLNLVYLIGTDPVSRYLASTGILDWAFRIPLRRDSSTFSGSFISTFFTPCQASELKRQPLTNKACHSLRPASILSLLLSDLSKNCQENYLCLSVLFHFHELLNTDTLYLFFKCEHFQNPYLLQFGMSHGVCARLGMIQEGSKTLQLLSCREESPPQD